MDIIRELSIKISRARYNLMFLLLLSLINAYFVLKSGIPFVPYSCSISTYALMFGVQASAEIGIDTPQTFGIIIAIVILAIYLLCYFKSKTNGFFMFLAFALTVADIIALIAITLLTNNYTALNIADIIIHVFTIFFVYNGVKAHTELIRTKRSSNETKNDTNQEIETFDETENTQNDEPIGEYIDDGTPALVSGEHNNLKIFTVIRHGVAELVINGMVCDRLDVVHISDFELWAIVNGIDISFQYKRSYECETMFLYADDLLIDSLNRI